MGKSSGGPSGETRYNWNPVMEGYWGGNEGHPGGLLGDAADLAGQDFQMYGMQPNQQRFMDPYLASGDAYNRNMGGDYGELSHNYRNMLRNGGDPLNAMKAARGQIEDTLGGEYLGQSPGSDPAANFYAGHNVPALNPFVAGPGSNEFIDQYSETDRNAFGGQSPYFRDQMMTGMQDITDAYQSGTARETNKAANLSGVYGGSAHQQLIGANQDTLGKNLSRYADSMLNQQYDRSAGMEDSFLQRDLQNQQQNRASAGAWREAQLGRGYENFSQGTDRGFQAAENAFNRGATGYEGERNRMMGAVGAGQAEQGLGYQRLAPMQDMVNFGMQNGQQQLDFAYNQWQQQQQHPYQSIDWLSGILGKAMGGGGMNTSMYGGGGSGANAANILGAGLGAYGMFRNG